MTDQNELNEKWWNSNPMTYEDWNLSKDIRDLKNPNKFKKINDDYLFHNPDLEIFFSNLNNNGAALDIGCGWGSSTVILSKKFNEVMSIDISKKSILAATENVRLNGITKRVILKKQDAENLTLENYFDLIYSWGVIHHSYDTEKILKKIFIALKKNGSCFIMIYNKNSLRYYLKGIYYLLFKLKILKGYNLKSVQKLFTDGYYQRHFTKNELKKILLDIGFKDIKFKVGHMQKSYIPFFKKDSIIDNFLKKKFGWFLIAEFKK